jgi:hypothetical protein
MDHEDQLQYKKPAYHLQFTEIWHGATFKKKKVLENVSVLCLNTVFFNVSTYCVGADAYR